MQLTLGLGLKDSATFDNYLPGPNGEALAYLSRLEGSPWKPGVYLWGEPGTGKSHLLQAVCHAAGSQGLAAIYLPMLTVDQLSYEALAGIEYIAMVCIDDIQAIAGYYEWEVALIGLLDRIHASGAGLVITGHAPPAALGLKLPPLASRLAGGLVFQLKPLNETDKLQALQEHALRRGLPLSAEAGRYLVRYHGRDMTTLLAALEALDQASLTAKRKLTVPFIRSVLSASEPGS